MCRRAPTRCWPSASTSGARQTVTVTAEQKATVSFALSVAAVHESVVVTGTASGTATAFESFSSVTSLDSVELAKERGATITEALANEPGIAVRSFGPGNARPIIRGFDGDRVLIMQDGVRTGDLSSQSGDHGVSIDPASLERLEVVKGPATLLYGSNAIGGVVNAISPQDAFRASPFTGVLGGFSARHRQRQWAGRRQRKCAVRPWSLDGVGRRRCAANGRLRHAIWNG